jgi:hypothetical protein
MPMPRLCGGTLLIGIAVRYDLAVGGRLEPGQHHQAGRLARAGRAQHGQKLALGRYRRFRSFHDERFAVIALLNAFSKVQYLPCATGGAFIYRK